MTITDERPETTTPTTTPSPTRRFGLSATHLIASALAAITATVAASYLGVSGTVIGAAVASVLTVIGNAVYGHSLRSTGARMREAVPATARFAPRPAAVDAQPVLPAPDRRAAQPVWRRIAFGTVALFTGVLTLITGVELVAGRPISDLLRGDDGSGTTLFDGTQPAHTKRTRHPDPTPIVVTQTVTAKVVVTTPTVTQTAATPVTTTVTPTKTATSTPTPTATSSATSGAGTASQPAAQPSRS